MSTEADEAGIKPQELVELPANDFIEGGRSDFVLCWCNAALHITPGDLDRHTSQAQTCQGASGYMSQTGRRGYFAWHTEVRWTWEGGPVPCNAIGRAQVNWRRRPAYHRMRQVARNRLFRRCGLSSWRVANDLHQYEVKSATVILPTAASGRETCTSPTRIVRQVAIDTRAFLCDLRAGRTARARTRVAAREVRHSDGWDEALWVAS